MSEQDYLRPINVDGKKYFSVGQFAMLTYRTHNAVTQLIFKGNRLRNLKREVILGRNAVPVEELEDFPFLPRGAQRLDYTSVLEKYGDGKKDYETISEYNERMRRKYGAIDNPYIIEFD